MGSCKQRPPASAILMSYGMLNTLGLFTSVPQSQEWWNMPAKVGQKFTVIVSPKPDWVTGDFVSKVGGGKRETMDE